MKSHTNTATILLTIILSAMIQFAPKAILFTLVGQFWFVALSVILVSIVLIYKFLLKECAKFFRVSLTLLFAFVCLDAMLTISTIFQPWMKWIFIIAILINCFNMLRVWVQNRHERSADAAIRKVKASNRKEDEIEDLDIERMISLYNKPMPRREKEKRFEAKGWVFPTITKAKEMNWIS